MRTNYVTRAGTPAAERFEVWVQRTGDENEVIARDNLTGAEAGWGDYLGIEPSIERWINKQRAARPDIVSTQGE